MFPLMLSAAAVALLDPLSEPVNRFFLHSARANGWVEAVRIEQTALAGRRSAVAAKQAEIARFLDAPAFDVIRLGVLYKELDCLRIPLERELQSSMARPLRR